MRKVLCGLSLFFSLASLATAAPPEPLIRLPTGPVLPPAPPPGPDAVTHLTVDLLYMIDSDVPVLVLASPLGLVSITEEAGPIKVRGKFVDGTGKFETRMYKGKAVFTVEAVGKGRVELLIVPQGAAKTSDVIRRTIDVDAGEGPIPPPPPPLTKVAWMIVVEETSQRTAAQAAILVDEPMWRRIEAKGVKWRLYDKDSHEAKDAKYPDKVADVGNLPAVLLLDEQGKKIRAVPFPKSGAELEALVGGGK